MRYFRIALAAMVSVALIGLVPTAAHADVPPPTYCSAYRVVSNFQHRACVILESSTRVGHQFEVQNLIGLTRSIDLDVSRIINSGVSTCHAHATVSFGPGQTKTFYCWSVRVKGYKYGTGAYIADDASYILITG